MSMKFKDIQEGKLYQNRDNANVYTKKDGLLYHIGSIYAECTNNPQSFKIQPETLHLDMYYCEYNPNFILDMKFREIKIGRV